MQCSNFAILEIVYFARISISSFCKAFAEAKTKRISVVKIQGIKNNKTKNNNTLGAEEKGERDAMKTTR